MNRNIKLLTKTRKEKGLTQKALSKIIGTTYQRIGMIERGETEPGFHIVEKMANAMELEVRFLLKTKA